MMDFSLFFNFPRQLNTKQQFPHSDYSTFRKKEHAACGVFAISSSEYSYEHTKNTIEALKRMDHRAGSVSGSGDGVGVALVLDKESKNKLAKEADLKSEFDFKNADIGIGVFFFKQSADTKKTQGIIEKNCIEEDIEIHGWRQVPIDEKVLVNKRDRSRRPEIWQAVFTSNLKSKEAEFACMRAGSRIAKKTENNADVASISFEKVLYKGMLTAKQLDIFLHHDLKKLKLSSCATLAHSRFATNTSPTWNKAQPFPVLAHNGEINTHESVMTALYQLQQFRKTSNAKQIKETVIPSGSDSQNFNLALQILLESGMSLVQAILVLAPPSLFSCKDKKISRSFDFYKQKLGSLGAWEGPAGVISFFQGELVAHVDRFGLRPLRWTQLDNKDFIVASEFGVIDLDESKIRATGQLMPGEIVHCDADGKIFHSQECFQSLQKNTPKNYKEPEKLTHQMSDGLTLPSEELKDLAAKKIENFEKFLIQYGWNEERLDHLLLAGRDGVEPVDAMGWPYPFPVLSRKPYLYNFYAWFFQRFAQETNPPLDPLREKKYFDLRVFIGGAVNDPVEIFQKENSAETGFVFKSPVLLPSELHHLSTQKKIPTAKLDASFDKNKTLADALSKLQKKAVERVRSGARIIVLDNMDGSREDRLPIPMIFAVDAVNAILEENNLAATTSIIAAGGDISEAHDIAVLISAGAHAVCPFAIFAYCENQGADILVPQPDSTQTIETVTGETSQIPREEFGSLPISREKFLSNASKSLVGGLKKIMSKMGVPNLDGYRKGYLMTVLGLKCVSSRFHNPLEGGVGYKEIEKIIRQQKENSMHLDYLPSLAREEYDFLQSPGLAGYIKLLRENANEAKDNSKQERQAAIEMLLKKYHEEFANRVNQRQINSRNIRDKGISVTFSDLLNFKKRKGIKKEQVLSIDKFLPRVLQAGHISCGAIWELAHEAIALGCNRLGVTSASGEGGESVLRTPGTESISRQVASGRFGVTAEYLRNAEKIQIKIAQGAKPGEGGHLPGKKVNADIAELRFCQPGIDLISPPPQHSIYSIEDLAQLIYNLRSINPNAIIEVKFTASENIGVVSCGAAKCGADVIIIDGLCGGTGAAPTGSRQHAGLPPEIGIHLAHHALSEAGLRKKVKLFAGGGIRTAFEALKMMALGADGVIFGSLLMAMIGCQFIRRCHKSDCPARVASAWDLKGLKQADPERYKVELEKLANQVELGLVLFGEEMREICAKIGIKNPRDIIGQGADFLDQTDKSLFNFDFFLEKALEKSQKSSFGQVQAQQIQNSFESQNISRIIREAKKTGKVICKYNIKNTDRSFGARTSGEFMSQVIQQRKTIWQSEKNPQKRDKKLRDAIRDTLKNQQVTFKLHGQAGQTLGFALAPNIQIKLIGTANDYVGEALSGGTIIIKSDPNEKYESSQNSRAGNVCFYGATSGFGFIEGRVGQRFGVRLSGAQVVCEGCGDLPLEYMTGGVAVVLGSSGYEIGAGMSDGVGFFYNPDGNLADKLSSDVYSSSLDLESDTNTLHSLIKKHVQKTGSSHARKILSNWDIEVGKFCVVRPKDRRVT